MNRLARIVSILLILMNLPAQAQEACSHNWEEVGGNAKLNPFPTRRPVSSSHGWVEDFRGPSLAPLAEIAWCNICNDATAQETWGIQCASSNGGYGWTRGGTNTPIAFQDIANLEAYIHDNMQEENLFMEAADNAYHFTRCQDGLFSSYFGQASVREDMLNRAYTEFDRIRTRVLSREQERDPLSARRALADSHLNCIKDSCAGRISTETVSAVVSRADDNSRIGVLDEEINQLLIGVPMANRQGMRDALRTLLRSNPNANLAAFTAVFDREMRQMKDQVDQTLQMFDGPRREGGGIRHSRNGRDYYCINHSLKRDMYASGLVDNVLEGYPATVRGERGLPCRACSRYGMAGQVTAELLMIPTYFIGYGFARLGAKVGASVVRAGLASRTTIATRMAMLGLQGVDYALFANSTVQACFGESFLVGSRGQSCNPENEVAQAFQEAAIGQCLTNIAFFGMSQAVALRQMRSSRGVAAAADDVVPPASVLDDVAEAAAEPTVVTASRRNFALNRQESARLESSLRSRGISSETELTDAQLLQLSSDERLFLFEEISGTALTVRESRSLMDIVANIQRTGWSGRNINRLTRLLRETDAEDIPTIIARLRQRRTLDLPTGAATPRAPTPPRPAVGPAAATEEELIRQFATRELTTREQNAAYLALARTSGRQSGIQFIDMQNIVLKRLNDQLRHKPLVDALNNRHAALLEEAIHRLRDDFPTLRIETYSDYKGARFALTGVPAGQESRLAREIARLRDDVDARFLREIQSGRYPTISRDLSNIHWYRTEVDETADFANIQVRTGLDRAGIQNLWNGIRTQRSNLQSRFGTTPLMRALDGDASVRIPTAEVFEILRKKSDNALVARILNRRHNLNLSADDVQLFRTYADDVDRFSPNLQIDARVQHDFSTATHGGITLDFGGLGSLNAEATAAGLARGFDLRSSVRAIRTNEAEVTQYLARTMEETETAVRAVLSRQGITARITRSGDDVVVIPDGALSPGVRDEILQAQSQAQARVLEQTGRNTNVRVSFFGSNVSGVDDRAILAAEGEGIEKILRDRLEFLLPQSELRTLTIGTDMLGDARSSGQIVLRLSRDVPAPQRAIIEREFRLAVEDANARNQSRFTGPGIREATNDIPPATFPVNRELSAETLTHIRPHLGWSDEQLRFLDEAIEARRLGNIRTMENADYWLNAYSPSEAARRRVRSNPGERPFRGGKQTSLFPDGLTPQQLVSAFDPARARLIRSENEIHTFRFDFEGNEYDIAICRAARCSARNPDRQLVEGDIATVHPHCGPGIRRIVPLRRAKEILLGETTPTRDSFIQNGVCE